MIFVVTCYVVQRYSKFLKREKEKAKRCSFSTEMRVEMILNHKKK